MSLFSVVLLLPSASALAAAVEFPPRMSPTVLSLMLKHAATVVSEPVSVLQPALLAVETMDVAAGMRIVAAAMLIPTPRLSRAAERLDAAAAVAHPPSKWLPEP